LTAIQISKSINQKRPDAIIEIVHITSKAILPHNTIWLDSVM